MQNDEIERNRMAVTFLPCSNCRADEGMVDNNYQTGGGDRYRGEANLEPIAVPQKQKNYETVDKILQGFLFVRASDIEAREPVDRASHSRQSFVQFNMSQYHHCKNDDTRISYEEEDGVKQSHGYFIISIEWMSVWRQFVNGKGDTPGQIDNKHLKQKILNSRKKMNFPEDENDLGLHDKEDFYILSVQFFKFFYDTYGCNQII